MRLHDTPKYFSFHVSFKVYIYLRVSTLMCAQMFSRVSDFHCFFPVPLLVTEQAIRPRLTFVAEGNKDFEKPCKKEGWYPHQEVFQRGPSFVSSSGVWFYMESFRLCVLLCLKVVCTLPLHGWKDFIMMAQRMEILTSYAALVSFRLKEIHIRYAIYCCFH